MKNRSNTLAAALGLFAILLPGCGLLDMPNKMDRSNGSMDSMKSKMDSTNGKMDGMNSKMDATNEAIHKQTLMVALDHLLAKDNTRYLTPVPTGMMPWGQAFATEMREDEFVQLVYLYMKDINEVGPDDSVKDASGKWPAELAASVDHDKLARFYAVMAISGFAPQAMIQQVVDKEITQGGQFDDTAYVILEARATFLHDILLKETLLSFPLDDPGKIAMAVERASDLDYIARLPFASSIGVKIYGMLKAEDNLDLKLDSRSSVEIWAKIDQAFTTELAQKYKDELEKGSSSSAEAAGLRALRAKVRAACAGWGGC